MLYVNYLYAFLNPFLFIVLNDVSGENDLSEEINEICVIRRYLRNLSSIATVRLIKRQKLNKGDLRNLELNYFLCYLWTLLKSWLLFERAYWAETYKCQYEPLVEKRNWYL